MLAVLACGSGATHSAKPAVRHGRARSRGGVRCDPSPTGSYARDGDPRYSRGGMIMVMEQYRGKG